MDTQTQQFILTLQKSLKSGELKSVERGSCVWIKVLPNELPQACKACLAGGAVFDSAFISRAGGKQAADLFTVYYLFRSDAIGRLLVLQAQGKEFVALSMNVNAAVWDERKMQDLTGLKFAGIPDSRPLIFHPESGFPPTRPVGGAACEKPKTLVYPMPGTGMEGEFEIAVGPVHAGIIEPGHFRFHVVGEQINKMETRMFYLHRGVEKFAEGKTSVEALPMIEQISGDESVANAVAYCHAVERALSLNVPERAEFIRAILLELERIYSHLADLGGMPTDVGFFMSSSRFAALREDMMRLNSQVSENRFLRGVCTVGGVNNDLDKAKLAAIDKSLDDFAKRLKEIVYITLSSSTFLDRAFSTGIVSERVVGNLALVGPGARAAGVSCDLRKMLPYSAYPKTSFKESVKKTGDVLSRLLVKIDEVRESARLIKWLASHMPQGDLRCELKMPERGQEPVGVGFVEAPRGGCTILVELESDGRIRRLACRTASFRNWRALEKAVEGNIVPDFPLINKSFNLSYAGADL